jgi:hypothetical protein
MPSPVWSWPVFRLLATDRCRVAAPWFHWATTDDDVSRLRRLAVEQECAAVGASTALERAAAAILYLPLSLGAIVTALRANGVALQTSYGVSRVRQFFDLLAYAWRLGLPPRAYYHLRLHRHPWKRSGRYFFDQSELHHLQRYISPPDIGALEDKERFAARASRHGLPLAPTIAVWRGGRPFQPDGKPAHDGIRRRDLFIKPADGYRSADVVGVRFDRIAGEFYDDTRRWSPRELSTELAGRSRKRTWLVQPWLENRGDLRGFSASALCNVRVVTARKPGGKRLPLMAAFRFPWKSEVSSSEPNVTLCASIDLETGVLRAAEARDPAIGRLVRHPKSGQRIEGFLLKGWPHLLESAFAAHDAWPEFPFIGWDFAFTSRGLVLLEGGPLWGATLAQIAGSGPLGLTAFPRIYLTHLINPPETRESLPLPSYAQSV